MELYHEGLSLLVETYTATKQFTKGEMLCRRMIEERSGHDKISEAGNLDTSSIYPDLVSLS